MKTSAKTLDNSVSDQEAEFDQLALPNGNASYEGRHSQSIPSTARSGPYSARSGGSKESGRYRHMHSTHQAEAERRGLASHAPALRRNSWHGERVEAKAQTHAQQVQERRDALTNKPLPNQLHSYMVDEHGYFYDNEQPHNHGRRGATTNLAAAERDLEARRQRARDLEQAKEDGRAKALQMHAGAGVYQSRPMRANAPRMSTIQQLQEQQTANRRKLSTGKVHPITQ